ncbi:hypothetical protein EBR21_12685, partial [bacterium]|nr:hypothetical protein [bacterium]
TENKKEYRIDAGGGYLVFMQTIAAADPFNFDAKKETIGSIGAFAYFAGLQASIPLSSGNNFLLGGRYQAWSANKIVELGGGSPSFKYALKITELVLKPGYEWPTCFGLGFYCALTGVVGKSNSSDVRLGAVQKPPLSTLEYTRFGGGSLLKSKFSDGFFGYVELEGSSSMGTLIRGDTEKTFSITPGLFVVNGGINLSL